MPINICVPNNNFCIIIGKEAKPFAAIEEVYDDVSYTESSPSSSLTHHSPTTTAATATTSGFNTFPRHTHTATSHLPTPPAAILPTNNTAGSTHSIPTTPTNSKKFNSLRTITPTESQPKCKYNKLHSVLQSIWAIINY